MVLLVQLFLAHIAGDFFLQPDKWVKEKEKHKLKSGYLYLHAAVHFLLIMAITGNPAFWQQALIITVIHLLTDATKLLLQTEKTKRGWFFADQLLHLFSIAAVWAYAGRSSLNWHALSEAAVLIPFTAVLFLLKPTSLIIKNVISKWPPNSMTTSKESRPTGEPVIKVTINESLQHAGQLIGIMERLMVFVFIMYGKWEGVGFLLAAKSVFRFGDLKDARDMKLTEYVLIGTFLSFGIALLTGLLTLKLLGK
ncbi:Protein of unknown function [Sediminibacterium ginsengisoli]|uniref:DUF3307 domain-containing protein n=2 Tax=Sediminibacterium ginsengisoli TaxID=413434 RepID=A0A1T4LEE2_9BACT|nr:Protein of unknown function [Sediminibacterium ginsengisoli]